MADTKNTARWVMGTRNTKIKSKCKKKFITCSNHIIHKPQWLEINLPSIFCSGLKCGYKWSVALPCNKPHQCYSPCTKISER